ncbi:MAG: hypothetical protein OXL37_16400 [Chloroflexota bacterium]|nr:hypothetical protein [Chloroflexota bacterium]MDE2960166.1 hypothetical protein [Chloroflexota bacterium]
MMRITELPQLIRTTINDWRVWITLSLAASLILNETIIGIREGQTIANALTRLPFHKVAYLLLVSSIVSQAAIGSVPFTIGVLMTLYDIALARRRKWREEAEQARVKGEKEGREQGLAEGRAEGRESLLREQIAAVLADDTLGAEDKNRVISILNAATSE